MKRTPLKRKTRLKAKPLKRKPAFATSSSKRTKATPMKRCDDLARAINRYKVDCEGRPGHVCKGHLQWAHIQPRTYTGIRHDEDNALLLCLGEHVYFTHRPLEFIEFVGEERWLDLKRRALAAQGQKIDWKAREAALRTRLGELL